MNHWSFLNDRNNAQRVTHADHNQKWNKNVNNTQVVELRIVLGICHSSIREPAKILCSRARLKVARINWNVKQPIFKKTTLHAGKAANLKKGTIKMKHRAPSEYYNSCILREKVVLRAHVI